MFFKSLIALASMAVSALVHGPNSLFEFTAKNIDGKEVPLKTYEDKVVMVVNTASKCGLTPQYAALEELYKNYKSEGFVVLAFPANDFRNQEPGSAAEIKEFCSEEYGVTFPMMDKITVVGDKRHEIFSFLIKNSSAPDQPIQWNFTKFLLDRTGQVRYRFEPRVAPNSPEVKKALEKLINEAAI